MDDFPKKLIESEANDREQAEKAGVFNERLTDEQEYSVWHSMSTLQDIAKETNSTLSDLLKMAGYSTEELKEMIR